MTHLRSMIADVAPARPDDDATTAEPVIILIDGARRLLDANRPAAALLDAGAPVERSFGRLAAPCQRDMIRIDRAIAAARRYGMAGLSLAAGAFEAEVIRMGDGTPAPIFILLARSPATSARTGRAARCFGLTPAENRLLDCLVEGLELKDAACRLGVARTTARTHLQRIFDKTGVRRQTDLQRMIALS
ncbi:LuxR family transcriptional regulator [Sphingopyxis sp. PAMC25046]|uniref:helix-turn-helix transcriptional regulator n=1 Tax=Sphingopyxis sp. PAMC25046 TaxID=2565556 RepID=UPI00109DCA16|nr:helix-turn-helix transcriptional regulator [Sphingopyxis sp. PAMC25046]QCB55614.1 LuxR family transcriptional regulator [Sphingopyxis sp. PAMC25046]